MATQHAARLTGARVAGAIEHRGIATAETATLRVNGCANAMPGASFTSKWYRNPRRLMSQSERLPS